MGQPDQVAAYSYATFEGTDDFLAFRRALSVRSSALDVTATVADTVAGGAKRSAPLPIGGPSCTISSGGMAVQTSSVLEPVMGLVEDLEVDTPMIVRKPTDNTVPAAPR